MYKKYYYTILMIIFTFFLSNTVFAYTMAIAIDHNNKFDTLIGQYICASVKAGGLYDCEEKVTNNSYTSIGLVARGKVAKVALSTADLASRYNLYKNKKEDELRTLILVYPTTLMVLVPKDSKIKKFNDLRKKRILYIGSDAQKMFVSRVLADKSWNVDDLFRFEQGVDLDRAVKKTCKYYIDGIALLVGHRSQELANIFEACNLKAVTVSNTFSTTTKEHKYFHEMNIPLSQYYNTEQKNVKTIGVYVGLYGTKNMGNQYAYNFVYYAVRGLQKLKKDHPELQFDFVTARDNPKAQPYGVDYHPGAVKYYKDNHYIK